MEDMGHRLTTVEDDIAEMKPAVAGLTNLRTRAGGVVLGLAVVGTIIGGVLGVFLAEIKRWVLRVIGN